MRFLHLIRPVMCVLPEVASPDRKVSEVVSSFRFLFERLVFHVPSACASRSVGLVFPSAGSEEEERRIMHSKGMFLTIL